MTLRNIEERFAKRLLEEAEEKFPLDLTEEGPLFTRNLPRALLTQLQFEESPQMEVDSVNLHGWSLATFPDVPSAQKSFPDISLVFAARPWTVSEFLKSHSENAILDFSPSVGVGVLSKKTLASSAAGSLHSHLVPQWASYALSPELWGPEGKWTRFHIRLNELFIKHDLLKEGIPGRYVLNAKAEKLSGHGFLGTRLEKSYLFVLPWTFSLTALKKLEEAVRQEF